MTDTANLEDPLKNFSKKDLEYIGKVVARELNKEYWTFPDVASYFSYSANAVAVRDLVKDPTFPKPEIMFGTGHRRWHKRDVISWDDKRRLERSKLEMIASGKKS